MSERVSERERDGGWRSVRMMDARVGEMPGASAQYDKSVILNHRYRSKAGKSDCGQFLLSSLALSSQYLTKPLGDYESWCLEACCF